ncbi:ROK family protein [Yersinia nurmii]|uniref:ROK family protein n=1 Tax=Yersinia nurmii TaxID=685706 RepID=A0AAW7JVK0_9GAMM|nr:ROK family protein [Yersinia nurmii]MDN0086496.1 ROK family protein [Yersinia nurmii]
MNTPLNRTTREMKINNVVLVTNTLKSLGTATKGELAGNTSLSIATCGAVLNELSLSGEVLALEFEESRGGRPAQRYAYNPDYFSVLSLYAAGSDTSAEIIWSLSSATGETLDQGELLFQPLGLATFYQTLDALLTKYPKVRAIGIGLPGVVGENGTVASCDISLFTGITIVQQLEEKFGIFSQAGNDMNYTAYGFYRNSCAGVSAPVAYIYKPELPCTGCGIVINGKVLHGANNFAGEVSHLPFNYQTLLPDTEEIAQTIVSLAAIINPVTVAISGPKINESQLADILSICHQHIPEKHMPTLIYRHSIRQDYLQGIAELTLQNYDFHRLFEL